MLMSKLKLPDGVKPNAKMSTGGNIVLTNDTYEISITRGYVVVYPLDSRGRRGTEEIFCFSSKDLSVTDKSGLPLIILINGRFNTRDVNI